MALALTYTEPGGQDIRPLSSGIQQRGSIHFRSLPWSARQVRSTRFLVVLGRLPKLFPASVVVLIHLPPERASNLVEVIRRQCSIPVIQAQHDLPLLPGQVIVVPPGRHLLITPDANAPRTSLIVSGAYPPSRPSADLLLATLATAVGGRAIAVILSGGGHDGATGATAVHVCGGTVLATDETSSDQYSMPLAAIQRDEAVDRILPARQDRRRPSESRRRRYANAIWDCAHCRLS